MYCGCKFLRPKSSPGANNSSPTAREFFFFSLDIHNHHNIHGNERISIIMDHRSMMQLLYKLFIQTKLVYLPPKSETKRLCSLNNSSVKCTVGVCCATTEYQTGHHILLYKIFLNAHPLSNFISYLINICVVHQS